MPSDRFNFRDKCKVWDNVRSQQGVVDFQGLGMYDVNTQYSFGLDEPNAGRDDMEFQRRMNEPNEDWRILQSRSEEHWSNQFSRTPEQLELYGNGRYLDNEPLREDIFEGAEDATEEYDFDPEE